MNKVFLIGRLTRDPELRYTGSNTAVATFSIAVNRNYANAQGEREADFININPIVNIITRGVFIGIILFSNLFAAFIFFSNSFKSNCSAKFSTSKVVFFSIIKFLWQ